MCRPIYIYVAPVCQRTCHNVYANKTRDDVTLIKRKQDDDIRRLYNSPSPSPLSYSPPITYPPHPPLWVVLLPSLIPLALPSELFSSPHLSRALWCLYRGTHRPLCRRGGGRGWGGSHRPVKPPTLCTYNNVQMTWLYELRSHVMSAARLYWNILKFGCLLFNPMIDIQVSTSSQKRWE